MHIPSEIKVLAHEYTITINPLLNLETGSMGQCCSNTLKINIDPNVPESCMADTLLHEIIEALKYQMQLEMEHNVVSALATGILTVIRDNDLDFRKNQS